MTATATLPTNWAIAGHTPTGTEILSWYNALQALTDPQTVYAPTWASSGTQPALVDGTLTAHYLQVGKWVYYTGQLLIGASTTFGTGTYTMSLPVTSASSELYVGACLVFDNSVSTAQNPGVARMNGTTQLRFYGSNGQVGATAPMTFAVNDRLIWTALYEGA